MILKKLGKYIPVCLAVAFVIISITSISYCSHTRDENRHLVRGVMLLETGDYRLNKHHPVFANVIAALPQLFNDKLEIPSTKSENWKTANKDALAEELIKVNGGKRDFVFNVLNISRYFMIIVFAVCSLWVVNQVRDEFGTKISNIFAFLYYLSPNLIANGSLVTTDALIVPLIFSTTMYLYSYSKYHSAKDLILFIFIGFLALITKYSALPVAFVWIIILGFITFKHFKSKKFIKTIGTVFAVGLTWLILLTAVYGFRFRSLAQTNYGDAQKTEIALASIESSLQNYPKLIEPVKDAYLNLKLPFPEYIDGFLDNVVFHNTYGHDTFLAGQYSKTGWWYYFPFAMAIKMPIPAVLGTVLLAVAGAIFVVKKRLNVGTVAILAIVPTFFMIISMKSSLNLGIRHVLVVFPFIYLGISYIVTRLDNNKSLKYTFVLLGVWYLFSCASIYPYYLEYFNEFVGGSKNGHFYLLDSNLSWAQDDFYVEDYVNGINTNKEIYLNPLEKVDEGIVVIDVDLLMGRDINKRKKTAWIREPYLNKEIKPIDRIANTYMVFEF